MKEKNGVGAGELERWREKNGSAGNGGRRVKKPPHVSTQACS